MRECVEAFQAELSDLVAFLRNAESETALTALLLHPERLAALTPEERMLVTTLSEAGTRKRRYLYVVAIVGLYGLVERYVDEILEAYVGALSSSVSHFDKLPDAIRKNHLPVSLELLKAIGDKTYHGDTTDAVVVKNLHLCLTDPSNFQLNGAAFVIHRGNINLDKFRGYLGTVGIESPLKRLSLMQSLEGFFS